MSMLATPTLYSGPLNPLMVAEPGGEAKRDEARAGSFDLFLDAAKSDDFFYRNAMGDESIGLHGGHFESATLSAL